MSKELKIMLSIVGAVILGAVALFLFANPQPKEASKPVDEKSLVREASHATSAKKDAKVKLVEFGDFQCPACGAAYPIVKAVMEQYKDNPEVSFIFRNFPLSTIHPNAEIAAEAAEAAGEQGKYWEMFDKIYANQKDWETQKDALPVFKNYATEIGLSDIGKFETNIKNRIYSEIIQSDYKDGESLGVNSTPTFFLNGEQLTGVPNPDELKKKIEEKLK